jgi:hypothetical protein
VTTDELFQRFQASAWRLEGLPAYGTAESDPSFAGWLALGGQLPPLAERPAKQRWMALVRAAVAEGRRMGRVHLLQRPLTPYRAYELASYPENAAAGEDVRIADADEHPELQHLLGHDFWLLDDTTAVIMRYDPFGRFLSSLTTADPTLVADYHRRQQLALAHAVPLEEYLAAA